MREIKFRGKLINGEWVYGLLCKPIAGTYKGKTFISNSVGIPMAYEVRPETVGEFIGMKDKEITDIYEGDFVEVDLLGNGQKEIGEIVFQKESFLISWLEDPEALMSPPREFIDSIKVIGNKYQHE